MTCGAWIETGEASEVAVCGVELDLVAMPTPNAPTNNTLAAAAGSKRRLSRRAAPSSGRPGSGRSITALCEGVLLNLDVR